MDEALNEITLIDSEEKYQQMARLIILKLAVAWLEKQDWLRTPYGGQNPVQDLVFQTQLTANRVWEEFFSKSEHNFNYDLRLLKKEILEISDLSPELKEFFNKKLSIPCEEVIKNAH